MGKGQLLMSREQPKQESPHIAPLDEQRKRRKIAKQLKRRQNKQEEDPHYEEPIEQVQYIEGNQPQQAEQGQAISSQKLKHLAICFPDSILEIPQTSALRAYFISEIARISSIFKVDQIIILRDHSYTPKSQAFVPCQYIARNLQYLQTPQYLRKHLFKMHPDLNNVGLMNPIEAQHHLKTDEPCEFREGVTLERPTKKGAGSWVDIGLKQQAKMNVLLPPFVRVTLRLQDYQDQDAPYYEAEAVSKKTPRTQLGCYWGYDVRIAKNVKDMFGKGQYDLGFLCNHSAQNEGLADIDSFNTVNLQGKSVVILFAGTDDLSVFLSKDTNSRVTIDEALEKFAYNLRMSNFGVKKLRLEEQLFITLSKLVEFTP